MTIKQLIPSKIIKSLVDMEALMDTKLNYQKYRNTLKSAKLPVLPYFGIPFLKIVKRFNFIDFFFRYIFKRFDDDRCGK